jgi:hypothetical protein
VNDIEQLKNIDLENQLKFARDQNKELRKEIDRLKMLLNGEDVIKNSLSSPTTPFDHLKSSYRNRKP